MGLSGCLAFLLILTSRRDELATLRADFASRLARGKQERFAAKVTWEAIQRIELCETPERIWEIMRGGDGQARLRPAPAGLPARRPAGLRGGRDGARAAGRRPGRCRGRWPLSDCRVGGTCS